MPICVECGFPVSDIFKQFSKGSIRLTRCENCMKIADKYVEHELVIIVLDLILHKQQVYRHFLFNRIKYMKSWFDLRLVQFSLFFMFLDAYMKWFIWKKVDAPVLPSSSSFCWSISMDAGSNLIQQVFNIFFNCASKFFLSSESVFSSFYTTIATLATATSSVSVDHLEVLAEPVESQLCTSYIWLGKAIGLNFDCSFLLILLQISLVTFLEYLCYTVGILIFFRVYSYIYSMPFKYNYIVMALMLSSFAKYAVLCLLVWPDYSQHPSFALVIAIFVLSSHVVALGIFTSDKRRYAVLAVACGVFMKALLHMGIRFYTSRLPLFLI